MNEIITLRLPRVATVGSKQVLFGDSHLCDAASPEHAKLIVDALTSMHVITRLRLEEGDQVAILCDDPEATHVSRQTAVEVTAEWTDWRPRRFYGPTWWEAAASALHARRLGSIPAQPSSLQPNVIEALREASGQSDKVGNADPVIYPDGGYYEESDAPKVAIITTAAIRDVRFVGWPEGTDYGSSCDEFPSTPVAAEPEQAQSACPTTGESR